MAGSGQTYKKTRSSSAGKTAPIKRDGYARGNTPDASVGTKEGKTDKKGYTGPNVQRGSFR